MTFAQKGSGEVPKMGRRKARAKFRAIKRNLDYIHYIQRPTSAQTSRGAPSAPYQRTVDGVSVTVTRRHISDRRGDVYQQIDIKDPSKTPRRWEKITGITDCFSRQLPTGVEKVRKACLGTIRGVLKAIPWVAGGAAVGIGMFYADRYLPAMGGVIAKVFEETASRGIIMNSEYIAAGLGAIGGASTAAIINGAFAILNLPMTMRLSFRSRMMKFIRDPANKDAVKALEDM